MWKTWIEYCVHSSQPVVPILSQTNQIYPYHILRYILILSFCLFLGFTWSLYARFYSQNHLCTLHAQPIMPILLWSLEWLFAKEQRWTRLSLLFVCFQPPSSVQLPNTVLLNTFSLCSCLNVRYQVSHLYKQWTKLQERTFHSLCFYVTV